MLADCFQRAIRRPSRYVVIDEYAWKIYRSWFGGAKSYYSVRAYLAFLGFCREKARAFGPPWTARRIEQAVFALGENAK
jgi:hypothetical protein